MDFSKDLSFLFHRTNHANVHQSKQELKCLNQCLHNFGITKVSPVAKQLLIQQVGFVYLRHFFQHRSRAKHWFKNLKILTTIKEKEYVAKTSTDRWKCHLHTQSTWLCSFRSFMGAGIWTLARFWSGELMRMRAIFASWQAVNNATMQPWCLRRLHLFTSPTSLA